MHHSQPYQSKSTVDMLIEIEQARSCVMLAGSTLGGDRTERERNLSAAKHLVGRVGRLVAEDVEGGVPS